MNKRLVEEEAKKLIEAKGDMFERYLRKPRNSSIGFLALNSAEKRDESRQHSRASNRKRAAQSTYSLS